MSVSTKRLMMSIEYNKKALKLVADLVKESRPIVFILKQKEILVRYLFPNNENFFILRIPKFYFNFDDRVNSRLHIRNFSKFYKLVQGTENALIDRPKGNFLTIFKGQSKISYELFTPKDQSDNFEFENIEYDYTSKFSFQISRSEIAQIRKFCRMRTFEFIKLHASSNSSTITFKIYNSITENAYSNSFDINGQCKNEYQAYFELSQFDSLLNYDYTLFVYDNFVILKICHPDENINAITVLTEREAPQDIRAFYSVITQG